MSDATVEFSLLCTMFDAVVRAKKAAVKRKHVRTFLEQVYTDRDYFSVLRLMLPALDKDRASYGVKEAVLGKYLAEALGLAKESADAQKLLNWRKGGTLVGRNAGNFAFIATEILHSRQRVASTGLKIKDVNDLLDHLAESEKREEKVAVFANMINKTNAQEMRWIIVIILKDLKLGISENTIFSEFHPDAQDLFNVTCNLKLVCERLRNRSERYNRQDIEVGRAVRPQLAARVANVEEAWKKFRGKRVTAEIKFDGDRIQIHKDGKQLQFYSRNFNDHQQFKEGMAEILIQNIYADKCILDGEMLVWDRSTNRFADFGSNREAAKAAKEGLETNQQLCYVAFDLLYHGSSSVIHFPLFKRQELLHKSIHPVKGRLELLPPVSGLNNQHSSGEPRWSIIANSAAEVERFFQETVENRDEGIILKDLDSKWEPSDRSGKWLKLKPDYVHTGSDLDVLIIGGYFGSGRRGGQIAQFLLGIAERPNAGEYPTKFLSFCKVGTGLTDHECEQLVQKLNPYFRRNEKNSKPPSCYIVTNNAKERPDVWVEPPDKSVIMEITSDVRTINTHVFAAPYGLRFPRVNRVRYEKPWYDCLDVQALVDMVNSTTGSTVDLKGYGKIDKKAKQSKRPKKGDARILPLVPSHMRVTDVSCVKQTSQIFVGLVFYFVNNPEDHSKDSLHKLVVENGGSFSMNLNDDVTHAIASERKGIKFQASTAHGDVIHYSWIIDCCNTKALLPVRPKYFLHLSKQTKEKMKADVDEYGDYYFVDIDAGDLSQLFVNLDPAKLATDCDELAHYQRKHGPSSAFCQFASFKFYFHKLIHPSNPDLQAVEEIAFKRQKLDIIMHAGIVCETLNNNVTHMIVYKSSQHLPFMTIVQSISPQERWVLVSQKLKILSHQWIDDHALNTGGHPSEAEYDLRDPFFRFDEQEIYMGIDSDPADTSGVPAEQFATKEITPDCRKLYRVNLKSEDLSVYLNRDKPVKTEEHGVHSTEITGLPKKRLITLEKPPKRQRRLKDHANAKTDVSIQPRRGKAIKTECLGDLSEGVEHPQKRSLKLEETSKHQKKRPTSHDVAETEKDGAVKSRKHTGEPNIVVRSMQTNQDTSGSHEGEDSFDYSSGENISKDGPVKPAGQKGVRSTFDTLMGDLFPGLDHSERLPPREDKNSDAAGTTMEKMVPLARSGETCSDLKQNFELPDSASEDIPRTAGNPSLKKKVSYKQLVGNLLKPQ